MSKEQDIAVCDVIAERYRQDAKWGEQNHSMEWWLAILMEEVGEAAQAILETRFGGPHGGLLPVRKEIVEVCAVAMAMIECIERNFHDCLAYANRPGKEEAKP
jgi:NTP pyrophosphatase (non-canonical NTP hydrolase)